MKIALLAVPFLSPAAPSIGLTQIKGRLVEIFGSRVHIRLFYLNHDFHGYFGRDLYAAIERESSANGIGEWIFRTQAFDAVPDNGDKYMSIFYAGRDIKEIGARHRRKITGLDAFIDELISRYRLDTYDLVGINATFNVVAGLAFCRHLKRINSGIITVMGGAGLYGEMGEALSEYYPHLDYVCSGSGLVSFPRLIEALSAQDRRAGESIDGIFCRGNSGRVARVSREPDINQPLPLDYDDFFESFYRFELDRQYRPLILLETSRGCYWKRCKFCGLNEDRHRFHAKAPERAIREINSALEKYDGDIEMVDNILPRHFIKRVLPYLKVARNRKIVYEVKADYGDEEMEILGRTGVKHIQPGIESLSSDILRLMDKGIDAFQSITMLKLCVRHHIFPAWNLIIGFPGMTEGMYEQLIRTIPLLRHLRPPTQLSLLIFNRYSAYWREPERYDLDLRPAPYYGYIYPFDGDFLNRFAYNFEDRNIASSRYRLLAEYYPRLKSLVDGWKKRWRGDGGKGENPPRLLGRADDDGFRVHDSRGEAVREYTVSAAAAEILELLETPMTEAELVGRGAGDPGAVAGEVENLVDKGLLFKEKDRYLGLLVPGFSPSQ